jgi:single-stranded-DNA-specific exonuclease
MDWVDPPEVAINDRFRAAIGGHPLVATILARRGIDDLETALAFLDPDRYAPAPPTDLPDLEEAAARLWEAIRQRERVLVWGDFDVDGQTSTALLVDALRGLGAEVGYHVPHRLKHGHGVQVEILADYVDQGYQVILTCDTGVAAHEAVEAAYVKGATVLITDHHALPPTLPDAPAVVNPQRLPAGHPLRDLPGVGVTYKLVQQLYALAGQAGAERHFLDLVALGIVADVATQRLDTRYLLQRGIEALRSPERVGLAALMQAAQVDPSNLSSDTIGYQVGPRLNALGRLDDARLAVDLLTTHNETHAQQIAAQLELLNNRRKQIEDQIYAAAQEQIVADPSLLNFDALVLGGAHWHPGVIGIVASRLVEQYHRPAVLLATPEDRPARGSARSVPGVDIGAAIAANADLLIGHGGHPGAAGLSIDPDLIPQFRRRLSNTVAEIRDPYAVSGRPIDALVSLGDLSMELAEELDRLAPFGEGNPPIHLMTPNLHLVADSVFGINKKHRRVTVEDEGGVSHVVTWWRGSEHPRPTGPFDLLYIPRINDYKGRRSLQLEWVDSRPVPGIVIETGPRYELVDLRAEADPLARLPSEDYAIWAEAVAPEELPFEEAVVGARDALGEASSLVIWTAPPGPQELEQTLEQTKARTVYVLARHAPGDTPDAFLKRLAGLVKYAIRVYDGLVSITRLAGATGQREVTVRQGLEWLAARGQVDVEWLDGEEIRLSKGSTPDDEALEALQYAIRALLAEAAAYRAYFRQADLTTFFEG